jgi:hypothetical protein
VSKLTIAIPTFNRTESFELLLISIYKEIENLNDHDKGLLNIHIHENSTSKEIIESKKEILKKFQYINIDVSYYLNRYNIGGNMNIMKCIDCVESGWVWIIGDDDILLSNSIKSILSLIKFNASFSSITFCSTQNIKNNTDEVNDLPKNIISNNINEFLNNVYFNNAGFISCNLLNTEYLSNFSQVIYETLFTKYPHLNYMLLCLDSNFKNLAINKIYVYSSPPKWDRDSIEARFFSLYLLPFKNPNSIKAVRDFIKKNKSNFKSKIYFYRKYLKSNIDINIIEQLYIPIYKYSKINNDIFFKIFKVIKNLKL